MEHQLIHKSTHKCVSTWQLELPFDELNVIAEGFETLEHKLLLIEEGCTNFQGYFFGKPVSIIEF